MITYANDNSTETKGHIDKELCNTVEAALT